MRVSSTEVQNNFGKFLSLAKIGEEVIITRNGKEVAQLIPCDAESMISEEGPIYGGVGDNRVTYEEFLKLIDETDLRYELINGEVYNLPSPNYHHQDITSELLTIFRIWFKGKKERPLTAPFDVTLIKDEDNISIVQPDIVVISDTENIDEQGQYNGTPSLVVEVVSKSTRSKDMVKKLDLYMQTGIKEYWIVHPDNQIVQVYNFKDSNIDDYRVYKTGDTIISLQFVGLEVDSNELFATF